MATTDSRPTDPAFEITGGALCLDFANTVDNRPTDHAKELLPDYKRLLSWSVQAGALSETEAAGLLARADQAPEESARVLERAREVREAIFSVFVAAARATSPPRDGIRILNEAVHQAFGRLELQPEADAYRWRWQTEPGNFEHPLWSVVRSAADLLTSPDLARVRECGASNCAWLFLDRSKNRTRRWCDMKVCGNRDKARRYRAATKSRGASRQVVQRSVRPRQP
jgi:predicted RNA-binding Zn ribbon-like protein